MKAAESKSSTQERVESVSQLTARIKLALERDIAPAWVQGEVSNLKQQASGHVYFSLKDAGAQISAVLFRGDALRQTLKLRDGMQVLARGNLSVYEPRGQYQLVVRALIEDGVGRLQREFEELKARLGAEGLFSPARKVAIPSMPLRIGFVTSPTGAAVQDFIRILERRCWRGQILILPSKVQGIGAAEEAASQIALAQQLRAGLQGRPALAAPDDPRPAFFDLLVVGRGGGSLEDLWAFNEEVLVRAVAACSIPIISAVGHEIDFSLCDFAADHRAETPSAAAELISSHFVAALEKNERLSQGLSRSLGTALDRARRSSANLRDRLRLLTPSAQVERGFLRVDDLSNRLQSGARHALQAQAKKLALLRARLEKRDPELRVQSESQRLLALWKRLQAASPRSVLNRGFAIVRGADGRPLSRAEGLQAGALIETEFADARLRSRVEG